MKASARALALACALVALAGSCGRPRFQTPAGFAPLGGQAGVSRAISPEGVRFQVRRVRNEPVQGLEFWAEALRSDLTKRGYRPTGEPQSFRSTAGRSPVEGRLFEWIVPYGADTWSYLTGVLVTGKRILVVEAAGESSLYQRHRAAMLESLRTLAP